MEMAEIAVRVNELPGRFVNRLEPDRHELITREIQAGEWGEGVLDLVYALYSTGTPITAEEHDELAELLTAMHASHDELDKLTVQR